MKGYRKLYSLVFAPYFIIFTFFFLMVGGRFWGDISFVVSLFCLVVMIILYTFSWIASLTLLLKNFNKQGIYKELLKINMIIKISHVMAYILIFLMGLLFSITIFTFAFSFFLIIMDLLTIIQSGTVSLAAIINTTNEGIINRKTAVLLGISQYIYCLDVIIAFTMYRKLGYQSQSIEILTV